MQFANPLKWAEFSVSLLYSLLHYGLTNLGYALQSVVSDTDNSIALRTVLGGLMTLVATARLGLQLTLGVSSFALRAIASPFKSFHENNGVHPVLGIISAVLTAAAVGVALYFAAPLVLGAAISVIFSQFVIPAVAAALSFMAVVSSGLIRDAYIWSKNLPVSNKGEGYLETWGGVWVPKGSHVAERYRRHNPSAVNTGVLKLSGCSSNRPPRVDDDAGEEVSSTASSNLGYSDTDTSSAGSLEETPEQIRRHVLRGSASVLPALPFLPFVMGVGIAVGASSRFFNAVRRGNASDEPDSGFTSQAKL